MILRANGDGSLGQITIGENNVADLAALANEVKELFGNPTLPFDQTILRTDPKLKYAEVMKVINIFSDNKVNKIAFAELGPDEGAPP